MKYPWHPQPGKHCLLCNEETLEYRYEEQGHVHIMHCKNCNAVTYGRKEYDIKIQNKEGKE